MMIGNDEYIIDIVYVYLYVKVYCIEWVGCLIIQQIKLEEKIQFNLIFEIFKKKEEIVLFVRIV